MLSLRSLSVAAKYFFACREGSLEISPQCFEQFAAPAHDTVHVNNTCLLASASNG